MQIGCHRRSKARSFDSYRWSPDRCHAPEHPVRCASPRELLRADTRQPRGHHKIEILFRLLHLFERGYVDFLDLPLSFVHNLLKFRHWHGKSPPKKSIVSKEKPDSQTSRFWSRMSAWPQPADLPNWLLFTHATRSLNA